MSESVPLLDAQAAAVMVDARRQAGDPMDAAELAAYVDSLPANVAAAVEVLDVRGEPEPLDGMAAGSGALPDDDGDDW